MAPPCKVLFVTAEIAPYSAIGGLAQVSHYLPSSLKKLGLDIRIFTPKYGSIRPELLHTTSIIKDLSVPTGEPDNSPHPKNILCNVLAQTVTKTQVPVYFLENREYYEQRANVYNYNDDHIRFGLLSRAALEFIRNSKFVPDLIHINDWHTGYLANYLRTDYKHDPQLKNIASLMSIHNLYQGVFDFDHATDMEFDDGHGPLAPFYSDRFFKQNSLKRGIIHADLLNTVSTTYSRELLTEEYAPKLHNLFKQLRSKLYGVLNGLDYDSFNPKTDKVIKRNYSSSSLHLRRENKIDLQQEFGLAINPDVPILSFCGRIDEQKGLELIKDTLEFILDEIPCQFVVQGSGDPKYMDFFALLEKNYPRRVGTHLMYDTVIPRKIFAGTDMLLMPSRYEPGGIVALEAMRYGAIPIVRSTGGLADSVIDFHPALNTGTGFAFRNYNSMSFLTAVTRAVETYKNKDQWRRIIRSAMEQDFSWDHAAIKYSELYQRACRSLTEPGQVTT